MEDRKTRRARERAELKLTRKRPVERSKGNFKKKECVIALICFIFGIVISAVFFSVGTSKLVTEGVNSYRDVKPIKQSMHRKTFGDVLE